MSEHQSSIEEHLLPEYVVGADQVYEQPVLSDHLIRLPGDEWALWRWVGLRGAGFPAVHVLRLADATCAATADLLFDAIDLTRRTQDAAIGALDAALGNLRATQEWDNTARRAPLVNALRRLKKGQLPAPGAIAGAETEAIDAFREASAKVNATRADFYRAFDVASAQITGVIGDIARTDRFREAIIWQNRRAFHSGLESLLKSIETHSRDSKQRRNEHLIASYLQRYCVKNDMIGFFGPVGWARFVSCGAAISARPGPDLLASRAVSFEQWSIDAVAEVLGKNKWLRPWLVPRRLPFAYTSGMVLHLPSKQAVQLSAAQAVVLQACDGDRTARAIVAELSRSHPLLLKSEPETYKLLEDLSAKGLIVWALEIPFEAHPEQSLRRVLERIGERRLREPALEILRELENARDAVARAAGDAEQLDHALGELEALFTRVTGASSTRAAGATYAARTLLYEDCRRDIEVEIGPALLQPLGPALSLLLRSARWFTYEAAAIYRKAFKVLYDELALQTGSSSVDMVSFWRQIQSRMLGHNTRPVAAIMRSFQDRWSKVLAIPAGQRRVAYSSATMRPGVLAAFDAPRPGWRGACYHSPDVMIDASSVEAIRRGDYQFVMGEIHIGSNTLRGSSFIDQHPCAEDLFQALEHDFPEPRVIPVTPRNWPEITSRTRPDFVTPKDFRLAFTPDACGIPSSRVLPIGNLVVIDSGAGLVVRTRDGHQQFDIIEFFADILSLEVIDGFNVLRPDRHTPRISIDRLVICREAWRFAMAELPFILEKVEAERFLAVRHWMRAQGIPRWVFIKLPDERKPFFVDFDSPILVEMLAKMIRRTMDHSSGEALLTITEMLPTFDGTWLPDASDQRYTSELRIVAVDQVR